MSSYFYLKIPLYKIFLNEFGRFDIEVFHFLLDFGISITRKLYCLFRYVIIILIGEIPPHDLPFLYKNA